MAEQRSYDSKAGILTEYRNGRKYRTPPATPTGGRKYVSSSSDGDSRTRFSPTGLLQNFMLPLPFRRRIKSRNSPHHNSHGTVRPRELIELASFGIVELEPTEKGLGHDFKPAQLKNPTWCDRCGDFIWGLYKSKECLRCSTCQYTCHQRCKDLVTLDCKGVGETQTTNLCEMVEDSSVLDSDIEEGRNSPLFFDIMEEELRSKIDRYNHYFKTSKMVLHDDGKTFHGFIKVHMNLVRPINVLAGARPPSIYDIIKDDDSGRKTLTSFYLPQDTVKALHVTSEYTAREVINALLKKFKVADNPHKFALYERYHDKECDRVKLRRILDQEYPLILALMWCEDEKQFVLQENETGEIMWEAFALPELNNFLKILDREEEEYLNQVKTKYHLLQEKIKEAIERLNTSSVFDIIRK